MKSEQVSIELQGGFGPIFIRVQLPLTEAARANAEAQLNEIRVCLRRDEAAKLAKYLEWMPTTREQLLEAERLREENGMDWHSAVARVLGKTDCGCPMCVGNSQLKGTQS